MDLEQALVVGMQQHLRRRQNQAAAHGGTLPPRLLIHPPACNALRRCAGQETGSGPTRVCPAT